MKRECPNPECEDWPLWSAVTTRAIDSYFPEYVEHPPPGRYCEWCGEKLLEADSQAELDAARRGKGVTR